MTRGLTREELSLEELKKGDKTSEKTFEGGTRFKTFFFTESQNFAKKQQISDP